MTAAMHEQEKINRARAINYDEVQAIPEVWPIVAERHGDIVAPTRSTFGTANHLYPIKHSPPISSDLPLDCKR